MSNLRFVLIFLLPFSCARKEPEVAEPQVVDPQATKTESFKPSTAPPTPPSPPKKSVPSPVAVSSPLVGINGVGAGRNCKTPASACSKSNSVRNALENAELRWTHLMADDDYDNAARQLLGGVDCLVLRGGNDIDPARFGEEKHSSITLLSSERENFDFALVREALRRKMPVLGICLGAQEVNVALGGDLIQDIPSELDNEIEHRGEHKIRTTKMTLVSEIYGASTMVHSNHHQSVDAMGKGLRVSAIATDGVIEAFEAIDRNEYPFLVGVQYHPELAIGTEHDKLFEAFAEACRGYAQGLDMGH